MRTTRGRIRLISRSWEVPKTFLRTLPIINDVLDLFSYPAEGRGANGIQPGSGCLLEQGVAMVEDARSDLMAVFEELFQELVEGRLDLEAWLPKAQPLLRALEGYRRLGPAKKEDLWEWYALSRANEVLIGGLASELPHQPVHL